MPAQSSISGLMQRYAGRVDKAVQQHANDETKYGVMRLPGGILSGIARLNQCGFGQVQEGKQGAGDWYWRAAGVVHEPEYVVSEGQRVPVRGLNTSIIIMIRDYKDSQNNDVTVEQCIADIMNHVRMIAGEEATSNMRSLQDVAAISAALEKHGPYFRFSTELSRPQIDPKTNKPKLNPKTGKPYEPRVFENWHGSKGLENYKPLNLSIAAVNDQTADPEPNGVQHSEPEYTPPPPAAPPQQHSQPAQHHPAPPSTNGSHDVLTNLVSLATERQDEGAMAKLEEMATQAGYSLDEVKSANDWPDVAEMIKSPRKVPTLGSVSRAPAAEPDGGSLYEEMEETAPGFTVGQVVKFAPLDKQTGKPGALQDVKIEAIDEAAQKVQIRMVSDQKRAWKGVPFDKIQA